MIVVDTGPLVAIANRDDPDHDRCLAWYETAAGPLLLPALVLAEVCFLIERESGSKAEAAFLRSVRDQDLRLESPTTADLDRMAELVERYSDLPLGATDASVVAIAERRKIATVATLDLRHFSVVRPAHAAALDLVPA